MMTIINCEIHGCQGLSPVSPKIMKAIETEENLQETFFMMTLQIQDIELGFYITETDVKNLPGIEKAAREGSTFIYNEENDAEEVIGFFDSVCSACFREHLNKSN